MNYIVIEVWGGERLHSDIVTIVTISFFFKFLFLRAIRLPVLLLLNVTLVKQSLTYLPFWEETLGSFKSWIIFKH